MKILNLFMILIGVFLITEGKQVSKVEKNGTINIGSAVDSKQLFGILKILDKKLNKIMDTLGIPFNKTDMALDLHLLKQAY